MILNSTPSLLISAIMGRYYFSKKQEADSLKKIKLSLLKLYGFLKKGYRSGSVKWTNNWGGNESTISIASSIYDEECYLELDYWQEPNGDDERIKINYKFPLVTTPCNFGGKRYWFLCNLSANGKYCGRRVAVLYKGGKYFACRHCYSLSYSSRNENRRYKDYPLFFALTNRQKIDELKQKMKRGTYAGNPTRKQRALNRLYEKEIPYSMTIYRSKNLDQ